MRLIEIIGGFVYCFCTDFMINAANLLGVTYQDTNAFMFFVLWPVVTVGLAGVVVVQRVVLWRKGASGGGKG